MVEKSLIDFQYANQHVISDAAIMASLIYCNESNISF